MQRLRDIHAVHFDYEVNITDDEIKRYIVHEYNRPGASDFLTVGDIIRSFIGALNILHQNPNYERKEIFGDEKAEEPKENVFHSRFSSTEE